MVSVTAIPEKDPIVCDPTDPPSSSRRPGVEVESRHWVTSGARGRRGVCLVAGRPGASRSWESEV